MALQFRTLDFRSIDGSNNNRADPTLNQANTDFARWVRRLSPMGSMK